MDNIIIVAGTLYGARKEMDSIHNRQPTTEMHDRVETMKTYTTNHHFRWVSFFETRTLLLLLLLLLKHYYCDKRVS